MSVNANFAELRGLTIWLLGASSGIGLALAERLAANKNFVYVTARREHKLQGLKQRFPAHIKILPADICDTEQLNQAAANLSESCDQLDLLILNAGTCEYDDLALSDLQLYRRVFELNYFAQLECLRHALPMLTRAGGRVVLTSSMVVTLPFPRAEAYGASKAALEYTTACLALDLKRRGLRFQLIRPGFVDTDLTRKNNFFMPWIMSSDNAALQICKGIQSAKSIVSFPWPLRISMALAGLFLPLWKKIIAPKPASKDGVLKQL